jgi:type III secretory pathway component EscT
MFPLLFGVDSTLIANSPCQGCGIGMLLRMVVLAVLLILGGFPVLFGRLDTSYKTTPTVSPGTNFHVHN